MESEESRLKKPATAFPGDDELFKRIFYNAATGIAITDWQGNFLQCNPAYMALLGYTGEELRQTTFASHIHPDDLQSNLDLVNRLMAGEVSSLEVDNRYINKQGQTVWVHKHLSILPDETGKPAHLLALVTDITERRRLEEALQEAQRLQGEVVKAANVGLWEWDLKTDSVRYSPEWKKQIGYEDHEIGNHFNEWRDRVHPDDLEPALDKVQRSIAEASQGHQLEFRFRHKNGSFRWILAQASVLTDDSGQPVKMMGSHIDITDRKRVEEKLRESEKKLRMFIEHAPVGLAMFDLEMRYVAASRRWMSDYGIADQDVIGRSHYDLFPEIPERWKEIHRRGFAGEVMQADEDYFERLDGTVQWVFWVVRPWHKADGEIGGIVIFAADITEKKQAEETIRKSQEKYRLLVENAGEVILVARDGIVEFVNNRVVELLGYQPEEVTGKPFAGYIHPEDRQTVGERHLKRLKGEDAPNIYPFRVIDKAGGVKWLEVNAVQIEWEGKPATLNFLVDVTERKEAVEERDKLQAQLFHAQKMEAIGTLAGGIAHDFNNILAAIMGYAEIALDEAVYGRTSREEINNILEASNRAKLLVQQILTFSRKADAELKLVDINKEIFSAANLLKQTLPKMIGIRLELASDIAPVMGAHYQIEQILMNLGTNARDAMPEGGTLTISAKQKTVRNMTCLACTQPFSGDYVVITVSDTGHGVSERDILRIFDPFFTTKDIGKGTGLGLSTVFGIVRSYNGHITCQSKERVGTTFSIYLPPGQGVIDDTDENLYPKAVDGGNETILLVDDEAHILDIVSQRLSGAGYTVLTAPDGEGALEVFKARGNEIDLVVLDMSMPGMGGHKCMQELLALAPGLKVIVATGYARDGYLKETMSSGAAALLSKPFSKKALLEAVRMVLDS